MGIREFLFPKVELPYDEWQQLLPSEGWDRINIRKIAETLNEEFEKNDPSLHAVLTGRLEERYNINSRDGKEIRIALKVFAQSPIPKVEPVVESSLAQLGMRDFPEQKQVWYEDGEFEKYVTVIKPSNGSELDIYHPYIGDAKDFEIDRKILARKGPFTKIREWGRVDPNEPDSLQSPAPETQRTSTASWFASLSRHSK